MTKCILLGLAAFFSGGAVVFFIASRWTSEDKEEDHWDGDHPPERIENDKR